VTSRAALGRASARKGKETERMVAAYLRDHGWPQAERMVRTGWRNRARTEQDPGDIRGTPSLVGQVKSTPSLSDVDIRRALDETAEQATAADYGVLVQRRNGKSDVGRWWAWLPLLDVCALSTGEEKFLSRNGNLDAPLRMQVGALVALLHRAGYGEKDA